MAIRIAHGLTPALSGAAGFFSDKEKDADRRGAVAAGAANQSFALAQRKDEAAFSQEMAIYDRQRQAERDAMSDAQGSADRKNQEINKSRDRAAQIATAGIRGSRNIAQQPGGSGDNLSPTGGAGGAGGAGAAGQTQVASPGGSPAGSILKRNRQESRDPTGRRGAGIASRVSRGGNFENPQFRQMQGNHALGESEQRIRDVSASMSQASLTPEGQRIAGDLAGKLRAIQSKRDEMRPEVHSKLLERWLNEHEQSGLGGYERNTPTVDSEMQGRFRDFGTGMGSVLQPNGEIKVVEVDPAKAARARSSQATSDSREARTPAFPSDLLNDEKTRKTYQEQAVESLLDDKRKSVLDENGDPAMVSARDFSAKDVSDRMYEMAEREIEIQRNLRERMQLFTEGQAGQSAGSQRRLEWADAMGGVEVGGPSGQQETGQGPITMAEIMGGVPVGQPAPPQTPPTSAPPQTPPLDPDSASNPDEAEAIRGEQKRQAEAAREQEERQEISGLMNSRRQSGDPGFISQYDGLAAQLKKSGRDNTSPEELIHPWTVAAAHMSGQKDPVGYAMKVAAEALESGDKHIATMSPGERKMYDSAGTPRLLGTPEQVQAQADKLPFNQFYYDADGYLLQRRPGFSEQHKPRVNTAERMPASSMDTGRMIGMP